MTADQHSSHHFSSKAEEPSSGDTMSLLPQNEVREAQLSRWMLVTTHLNLLYMLGTGLITGPTGFADKYYRDTLSDMPGWIPLFRDKVPQATLTKSIEDADYNKPCIAELDLSIVHCQVGVLEAEDRIEMRQFPQEVDAQAQTIFLPAPLPVSLVRELYFNSLEDRAAAQDRVKDADNVDLTVIALKVRPVEPVDRPWPPPLAPLSPRDDPAQLAAAQARGGVLAMLSNLADHSNIALAAYRAAFDAQPQAADLDAINADVFLGVLPTWLKEEQTPATEDIALRLYWQAVDAVANRLKYSNLPSPQDLILQLLREELKLLQPDDKYKGRLQRLIAHLSEIAGGMPKGTITEMLEREKGSFSRSLLLFFLNDSCEDFFNFSHVLVGDSEYVLAAILLGASTGWAGLFDSLRKPASLATFVPMYMAEFGARHAQIDASFGSRPCRPVPWRELFEPGAGRWCGVQKKVALEISRRMKWNDCMRTHINLGHGNYKLRVDQGGIHLLLHGDVKAVETEPDQQTFMSRLTEIAIGPKIEQSLREQLKDHAGSHTC